MYWVKKKQREETGNVKGEKWVLSKQYIGDWKQNKKDGYGIIVYSNLDKYEGYWKNDMRHGKGTYWLSIGKNKYRKFYTGDWFENKKEGKGIFFYKDGGCYDGNWKNSKRHGKGLMIYANGDIYDGNWINDLKHGYGIIEYKNGNKFYGYWSNGLKEGQGYYYYSETGKIYLGEWHEDIPRTGIFTDVKEDKLENMDEDEFKSHLYQIKQEDIINDDIIKRVDKPSEIRILKLKDPALILEESITNYHFLRQVKLAKTKNFSELFDLEYQDELYSQFKSIQSGSYEEGNDNQLEKSKIQASNITLNQFLSFFKNKFKVDIEDEVIELVLRIMGLVSEEKKFSKSISIDFLRFCHLNYLMIMKYIQGPPEIDFSVHTNDNISTNNNNLDHIDGFNDYHPINNVQTEQDLIKNLDKNFRYENNENDENEEYGYNENEEYEDENYYVSEG